MNGRQTCRAIMYSQGRSRLGRGGNQYPNKVPATWRINESTSLHTACWRRRSSVTSATDDTRRAPAVRLLLPGDALQLAQDVVNDGTALSDRVWSAGLVGDNSIRINAHGPVNRCDKVFGANRIGCRIGADSV